MEDLCMLLRLRPLETDLPKAHPCRHQARGRAAGRECEERRNVVHGGRELSNRVNYVINAVEGFVMSTSGDGWVERGDTFHTQRACDDFSDVFNRDQNPCNLKRWFYRDSCRMSVVSR